MGKKKTTWKLTVEEGNILREIVGMGPQDYTSPSDKKVCQNLVEMGLLSRHDGAWHITPAGRTKFAE